MTVLDEVQYCEVDQILTVEPDEAEALRQEPNTDCLILVACTPTGLTTQRLLVRGPKVRRPGSGGSRSAYLASGC
ncbi:hypothetical protein GCM10009596_18190 [Arthrobacter rhombi]